MKYETTSKAELRFVGTSHGTTLVGNLCSQCIYNNAEFSVFGEHPQICCFDITETCSSKTPYFFFKSRSNSSVVVFSKGRIPFELPKANAESIKQLKTEIVLALEQLKPFGDSVLCARYGTTDPTKGFFDIENVLLYNIGTRNFNTLSKHGIVFASIPCSEIKKLRDQWDIPDEYVHYYEYTLLPGPIPLPQAKVLLAEWEKLPFCKCTGLTPFAAWNAIKNEAANITVYDRINCDKGDCFSLVLEIEKPRQAKFRIMTAMKPLLDGLICAFQNSDFESDEIEYFSHKLQCGKDKFQSQSLNVLGNRQSKYIQIYRNNVKWNPADDLCHYVCISIKEGNNWRLSGKIYKI